VSSTGSGGDRAGGSESPADREYVDEWSIRRIVRTMIPLLAALSVLQLVSGTVLETYEETLVANPALLVLVPVQIGTAGNLASITCSRLTTQLYLGTYELDPSNPDLRANVGAVFALAGTVFGVVGVGITWGGALQARSMALFESAERGTGFGLMRTSYGLLGASGNVITGWLATVAGWPVAFGVVAAIAAVVAYKFAVIVTTSFIGTAYLVYVLALLFFGLPIWFILALTGNVLGFLKNG
jgi:mgtE-like transporter